MCFHHTCVKKSFYIHTLRLIEIAKEFIFCELIGGFNFGPLFLAPFRSFLCEVLYGMGTQVEEEEEEGRYPPAAKVVTSIWEGGSKQNVIPILFFPLRPHTESSSTKTMGDRDKSQQSFFNFFCPLRSP